MPSFINITTIKITHTLLWAMMVVAILYIVYCGLFGIVNQWLWVALGLQVAEIGTLLAFGWNCPLTILAKKVKPDWKNGDDLMIPIWMAIHNKTIFGSLLAFGVVLLAVRAVGIL